MTKRPEEWKNVTEQQWEELIEEVTKSNCGKKLKLVREITGISRRELAKVMGVSEATIRRIETGKSEPTDDFMYRVHALCAIGVSKFGAMSEAEKEKISETFGVTGGTLAGIGGAIGAVSASGAVAGLSAAGMTSGLAAIGGGAMLTGIGVVAAIPVATGLLGYGLVKGIKYICEANKLDCQEVDEKWEITTRSKEMLGPIE